MFFLCRLKIINTESESDRYSRLINRRWKRTDINWKNAAFVYESNINYAEDRNIEIQEMNKSCIHCQARKYKEEAQGLCCSNGKFNLQPMEELPNELNYLFYSDSAMSKQFLGKLRQFNSAFQMTSFGATKIMDNQGFNSSFKIQGQVYHLLGGLEVTNNQPKFLQLYFMGNTIEEVKQRCNYLQNANLNEHIIK